MIVIVGTLGIDPRHDEAFRSVIAEVVDASLREPECHLYNFAADVTEAGTYRIVEEWTSREALDRHIASAHYQHFRAQLKQFGVHTRRVDQYEVAEKTTLA